MSQMNPKSVFHNTAYSVQLPYIAGHSLQGLWIKGQRQRACFANIILLIKTTERLNLNFLPSNGLKHAFHKMFSKMK